MTAPSDTPPEPPPPTTPAPPPPLPASPASTGLATRVATPIDVANKALQMLALIVAGAWAYWTWQQSSAPSLGTGLATTSNAKTTWNDNVSGCAAYLSIGVENVGTKNVDVAKAVYELFKAPRQRLEPGEKFKFLEYPPPKKQHLSGGDLFPTSTLAHVYPPKAKSSQSIDFLISPEETDDLFYSVELLDRDGKRLGDEYGSIDPCEKPIPGVSSK